ncbi:cyanuric acid amidohydrolase [Marinibacterium profundimaris]|uniref:Cyanuric acid amidohydrolase n=1 Tax=Marinibacterium profundimaris TaxID=1679460 RepID=A0A225NNS4_9RHOB|nr:ring-opening amidohydrolase [Marinibacterium profundimaris]OWU75939.1 cyanuric acid amidohydrolase [Marinibacterium profundimaris]
MPRARLHLIRTSAPDDVSGLMAHIDAGEIDPSKLVAILGKTEGNGCVNDFTRAFSVQALTAALGAETQGVAMVMSGGTEGGLCPHILTFEVLEDDTPLDAPALAIGSVITRDLKPEEIGTVSQIEIVAEGVAQAMAKAGIPDPADVHFVQIKCPLLTAARVAEAAARDAATVTTDTLKSMGFSRGASALGVAVALGEASPDDAIPAICTDPSVWSSRASTSAGIELMGHEIIVMGMSETWSGPLVIDHAVMSDQIDIAPVIDAMTRLNIGVSATLKALLAKAEPGTTGTIRGNRHIMLDDSDIAATRHARAFVGGALAGIAGRTDIYVSGGAEHQGPDGGGPVALIAERTDP